jgi:hypothetical protein
MHAASHSPAPGRLGGGAITEDQLRKKSTTMPVEVMLMRDSTVLEYCERRRISRSFFYKEQKLGQGPRLTKRGRRTIITAEDDLAHKQSLHAEAAQ